MKDVLNNNLYEIKTNLNLPLNHVAGVSNALHTASVNAMNKFLGPSAMIQSQYRLLFEFFFFIKIYSVNGDFSQGR